jgi:protein-histidine pros-kinase
VAIFAVGFALAGIISYNVLQNNAREEVLQHARLMMEAATSTRNYTNVQVRPLLETQLKYKFVPQAIPFYAATEQFIDMRKKYPDYSYKEATLNPTNPRDHATDWEVDVVNNFRQNPAKLEATAERDTPEGKSLYFARPIQIKDAGCLVCHSTPDAAPKTMIEAYGSNNGFGWKMNEIVGAQVVSVPATVPMQRASYAFKVFLFSLAGIFLFTMAMLNVMLYWFVIRRVTRLSKLADAVSLGNLDAGDFRTKSRDEIGVLTEALNRMKMSMVQALKMLEG